MIAGSKIILGALMPADYVPLFNWFNDVEAARMDTNFRPVDMASHLHWCQNISSDSTKVIFAIRRIADPVIIGFLKISNINAVHRTADMGIRIGEESNRNKGFGTEAMRLGLEYCWNYLNLQRITLIVFSKNVRALSVYRSLGFKKEGLLRRYIFTDGAWVDAVVMAAFRPSQRKPQKAQITAATADHKTEAAA